MMTTNYHACIFRPFTELRAIVDVWSSKCGSMAVAEHPAEGKTKRIHCHFLICDAHVGENAFREALKKQYDDIKKGDYWISLKTKKQKLPIARRQTLVYILKGQISRLKFKNLFSDEEVEEAVKAWVDPDKPETVSPVNTIDTIVYEVLSKKVKRVNLNKEIMTDLLDWYTDNARDKDVPVKALIAKGCELVRSHDRGINPFQVRDFVNYVLFADEEKKHLVIDKIYSLI